MQFKPFDAWSSNAEWCAPEQARSENALSLPEASARVHLPRCRSATLEHKEHPVSLALGSSFCAVLTSNSRLLLLSLGGLQLASWELPGRGLSLAASGQSLAAFSIQAGQAQPVVELFDVGSRRRLLQTSVPLSRGASVTWAGFAADEEPEERGSRFAAAPPLAVHDSKGVLRVLRPSQGAWAGTWARAWQNPSPGHPSGRDSCEGERTWVVGCSPAGVSVLVTATGFPPQPGSSRPVVTLAALGGGAGAGGVAGSSLGAPVLELEQQRLA